MQAQCDAGDGAACRAAGSLHDGGFGVSMDKRKAATAYAAGCAAKDLGSCARFAVLQAQGTGTAKAPVTAVATLNRLCGQNVDDACVGWALLLIQTNEIAKARTLLKKSCANGFSEACEIEKKLLP